MYYLKERWDRPTIYQSENINDVIKHGIDLIFSTQNNKLKKDRFEDLCILEYEDVRFRSAYANDEVLGIIDLNLTLHLTKVLIYRFTDDEDVYASLEKADYSNDLSYHIKNMVNKIGVDNLVKSNYPDFVQHYNKYNYFKIHKGNFEEGRLYYKELTTDPNQIVLEFC